MIKPVLHYDQYFLPKAKQVWTCLVFVQKTFNQASPIACYFRKQQSDIPYYCTVLTTNKNFIQNHWKKVFEIK